MGINIGSFLDLATGIVNPNDQTADTIIERLLPKLSYSDLSKAIIARDQYLNNPNLTPEQREALFYKFDPVSALFNEFDLNRYKSIHILLRKRGKRTHKSWWDYISEYLRNPEKLYTVLSKNDKAIADLLQTKEGLEYLKYLGNRDYDFFYRWTWFFPRYHRGCNGRIKYGRRRVDSLPVWGFYCARCGEIIPEDIMNEDYKTETYTYMRRKKTK